MPYFFYKKTILSFLLIPFRILYIIVSKLRWHLQTPYKSKAKIICVGNITLGGTGKTPAVIKLADELLKQGFKVGIISRGYKGNLSSKIPVLIDINKHTAKNVGDEPFMIKKYFQNKVPLCICKNRGKAIKTIENFVDIIIADDGFQNNSFYKDINILVFDDKIATGNNMIFPSGPLRQSLKTAIKKTDAIILNRFENNFYNNLICFNIPIFKSKIKIKNLTQLQGEKVIAFSGISNNQKFFDSIKQKNLNLIKTFSFKDHYQYTTKDIEKIITISKGYKILTTTKDFVKIPSKYHDKIIAVETELEIENINNLIKLIKEKLN